jgi:membrane protease YdiL (CAAX protease family)
MNKITENQFSLPKFLGVAFLPGIVILIETLLLSNPVIGGLPLLLAVLLAVPLGLIPTDLFIIFYFTRKEKRKFSEVVGNQVKLSVLQTAKFVVPVFIFIVILASLWAPIEHNLWSPVFSWLPEWFRFDKISYESIPANLALVTVIINLVFNGIFGPLVEEIYFRGFLLPRIDRFGKLAPLIDSIMFTFYHFFNPFELIFRLVAFCPIAYLAWWKKSFRLSATIHILVNLTSSILMTIAVLSTIH